MLPAVADPAKAQAPGAPLIHDVAPNNTIYQWHLGDQKAADAAFKAAKHVTKLDIVNNRLVPNAMEPRAAIGDYDPATTRFTLWNTSQNPHVARLVIAAFVGMAPEHKLRVIAPDVGGGFGSKIFIYPEEVVCLWASQQGRPAGEVDLPTAPRPSSPTRMAAITSRMPRWRSTPTARSPALRVKTIANLGAYMSTFSSSVPTYLYATLLSGQYDIPAIYCEVDAVYTNTVPVDAYRGAGRPEATFVVERLVEVGGARAGHRSGAICASRTSSRRFPHQTPVIMAYDAGDYDASLKKALEHRRRQGLRQAQARSGAQRQAARHRLSRPTSRPAASRRRRRSARSAPASACGNPPRCGSTRPARSRCSPARTATARATRRPSRRSSSERLGIPIENVDDRARRHRQGAVRHGHLRLALAARSACRRSSRRSTRSRPRPRRSPPIMLEAAEGDIEFKDGKFTVAGTDKSAAWGDVALNAYIAHKFTGAELEPGLKEGAFYDPTNFTFPAGCHICEVEIDPETGDDRDRRLDRGRRLRHVINPMIVEGQVHGGIAQGVGQALLEDAVYDKDGQLVTGSYMDYAMPRADDLPSFKVDTTETQVPVQPARHQGLRRGGRDRGAAAVINAITDAIGTRRYRHAGDAARRSGARSQKTHAAARRRNNQETSTCTTSTTTVRHGRGRRPTCSASIEEAKLLAGGQTLIPTMKLRLAQPTDLIDLDAVEELVGHRAEGPLDRDRRHDAARRRRELAGGARTRSRRSPSSPASIGDPQVRHRGTIGGSVANNDPTADYPAAVLGLGATIITNKREHRGRRLLQGHVRDRARAGRDHHQGQLPDRRRRRPTRSSATRPRASRWSACSCRSAAADIRVAVTGAGSNGVFRVQSVRGGAEEALLAEVARGHDDPGRRHEQRHPRQRRIPRASGRRAGAPGAGEGVAGAAHDVLSLRGRKMLSASCPALCRA